MEFSCVRIAQRNLARSKKRSDPAVDLEDRNILVKDADIWNGKGFARGSIFIQEGRINRIARSIIDTGVETIDAAGFKALPGFIDVHVHLRDMELAYKEDFATGTAAAAAGGFTTVLDMPNTVPPTDSARRVIEKQKVAAQKTHVNVGFHAAAVSDSHDVESLAGAGAFSLKLYMPKPIVPFDVENDQAIQKMMRAAGDAGMPVTVHAEDVDAPKNTSQGEGFEEAAEARPPIFETRAVDRLLRIQKKAGCNVHYCHLTLRSSLMKINASTKSTSEVTPHHLLLSKQLLSSLGWRAWMVPPLRSEETRRSLLKSTLAGLSSVIASDHAPHTIKEKNQSASRSPPGVPGLETTLPLMLTLVNRQQMSISLLVKLLSENPARIFGFKSKAKLQKGADGDVVLVDLKKKSKIDSSRFFSKAKFSPFDEFKTQGAVHSTIVGGKVVYREGEIVTREGSGSVLHSGFSG
ncbi:dihydroorotase [Candidatus Bathyarchaeota archaeon]|nr:MAG: dihydroorotase [Candidatus Bathyarchaeota archaeon]